MWKSLDRVSTRTERGFASDGTATRIILERRLVMALQLVNSVPLGVPPASIVFVIDGDVSAREALGHLISTAGWEVRTFASAQEFLSQPYGSIPCCIVLEMMLPVVSGLELQERLADRTDIPIIFLTGRRNVAMTVQAMKAGALEVLTKPFKNDAIVNTIRAAIERSRAALRDYAELRGLQSAYSLLTPREREVMGLVVSGLLNKQVGGELGISEITVKAHRGQVMRKMTADSLPALVRMAATLGLPVARNTMMSRGVETMTRELLSV
jgi:FixJ family two-component response regulator